MYIANAIKYFLKWGRTGTKATSAGCPRHDITNTYSRPIDNHKCVHSQVTDLKSSIFSMNNQWTTLWKEASWDVISLIMQDAFWTIPGPISCESQNTPSLDHKPHPPTRRNSLVNGLAQTFVTVSPSNVQNNTPNPLKKCIDAWVEIRKKNYCSKSYVINTNFAIWLVLTKFWY